MGRVCLISFICEAIRYDLLVRFFFGSRDNPVIHSKFSAKCCFPKENPSFLRRPILIFFGKAIIVVWIADQFSHRDSTANKMPSTVCFICNNYIHIRRLIIQIEYRGLALLDNNFHSTEEIQILLFENTTGSHSMQSQYFSTL